jgi:hypothetical protein
LTCRPEAIYLDELAAIYTAAQIDGEERSGYMSVHLTPTELAEELHMKRRDVLSKCIEMNVPVLKGRIDKTLFVSSLRAIQAQSTIHAQSKQATA